MQLDTIYNENCLDTLNRMRIAKVRPDLVVTSPPYDDLRVYGGRTYGADFMRNEFPFIAEGLYQVMAKGGVVVWIVGDQVVNYSETGTSFSQALYFMDVGFKLHDTMIYQKSGQINRDTTRYTQAFEYMFVLSKGRPKTIHQIEDKRNKNVGKAAIGSSIRAVNGARRDKSSHPIKSMSVRTNVWQYVAGGHSHTTDKIAFNHPATFPEKLVLDHITSWSNEGDLVYDPFLGSGTTAKVARNLNRRWIGSEINEDYCAIAQKRLSRCDLFDPNAERNYVNAKR